MATNVLELATTLKYLGAKWLPGRKVNFTPCRHEKSRSTFPPEAAIFLFINLCSYKPELTFFMGKRSLKIDWSVKILRHLGLVWVAGSWWRVWKEGS